jgi:hypothetical protein
MTVQVNRPIRRHRPLFVIARDVKFNWQKVNYAAQPYLDAMLTLQSLEDNYFQDSGRDIVLRFLANATTWRGEKARTIKKELRKILYK